MSALIPDNTTLLKYIPNTLKAVAGEASLYDKIQYHLLHAETWLTDTFVSTDTMSRIKTYSDITPLLHFCRIIVASEAMLHAIPQLDLILTPNGFGIVSNQNIAPASKERIERLLYLSKKHVMTLCKLSNRCFLKLTTGLTLPLTTSSPRRYFLLSTSFKTSVLTTISG